MMVNHGLPWFRYQKGKKVKNKLWFCRQGTKSTLNTNIHVSVVEIKKSYSSSHQPLSYSTLFCSRIFSYQDIFFRFCVFSVRKLLKPDALKIGQSSEMRRLVSNHLHIISHVSYINGPLKMEFDCTIKCEYVRTVNIRIFCYL